MTKVSRTVALIHVTQNRWEQSGHTATGSCALFFPTLSTRFKCIHKKVRPPKQYLEPQFAPHIWCAFATNMRTIGKPACTAGTREDSWPSLGCDRCHKRHNTYRAELLRTSTFQPRKEQVAVHAHKQAANPTACAFRLD
eukprot:scaffold179541_cov16-Tisochrysis_lutea.AAC.2